MNFLIAWVEWTLALIGLLTVIFFVLGWWKTRKPEPTGAELVDLDYHRARRQMNVAAGQSWRNLVD